MRREAAHEADVARPQQALGVDRRAWTGTDAILRRFMPCSSATVRVPWSVVQGRRGSGDGRRSRRGPLAGTHQARPAGSPAARAGRPSGGSKAHDGWIGELKSTMSVPVAGSAPVGRIDEVAAGGVGLGAVGRVAEHERGRGVAAIQKTESEPPPLGNGSAIHADAANSEACRRRCSASSRATSARLASAAGRARSTSNRSVGSWRGRRRRRSPADRRRGWPRRPRNGRRRRRRMAASVAAGSRRRRRSGRRQSRHVLRGAVALRPARSAAPS